MKAYITLHLAELVALALFIIGTTIVIIMNR